MLFEIYGQMQLLLQTLDELEDLSLSSDNQEKGQPKSLATEKEDSESDRQQEKPKRQKKPFHKAFKRPRARGQFWSTPPEKTPPATSFPTISKTLKDCRSELPAGKARSDFLKCMEEADQSSRVVLVTGDTGCGKFSWTIGFIVWR